MIAFSGLDGAGKSTQIKLLESYWKNKKNSVVVFWSRGGYTPGMLRIKTILRKSRSNVIPEVGGESRKREKSFANPIIRKTWLSLSVLDLIFYYGLYFRFQELIGKKIICDRYIFDTLIDFRLNFPNENVENWMIWKLLLVIALKPQKHFVLTIPVDESQRRSKLKDEPFPDSPETLDRRLNEYLDFVSNKSFAVHIDGTNKIKSIHQNIIGLIA